MSSDFWSPEIMRFENNQLFLVKLIQFISNFQFLQERAIWFLDLWLEHVMIEIG